jgi:carboxylate-amine ligase
MDERTMGLVSSYSELIASLPGGDAATFKPELMQCVLEIITGVCETVGEAEEDLRTKVEQVEVATDQLGLRPWWGGTHPFSS